jgi:choline dehydrogenase
MSWGFFVQHHANQTQARQDPYFTYRLSNGSYYHGINPPKGAEPMGMFYPRAGSLGGCSTHNAMGFTLPPDSDWNNIASLTGDASWRASNMFRYFEQLERCHYMPNGTAGHGFNGYISVSEMLH